MYLCVLDGSVNSCGIAGHRTAVTTLWVGHHPTILASKINFSKLCSSSTWHTRLRPDHLCNIGNTGLQVSRCIK